MTVRPVRLQLSRRKGFSLQRLSAETNGLEAVKVDRSTRWGNPFNFKNSEHCWSALAFGCRGDQAGRHEASIRAFRTWINPGYGRRYLRFEEQTRMGNDTESVAIGLPVTAGEAPDLDDLKQALRGRNLGCWCRADQPCHADVLLELANA